MILLDKEDTFGLGAMFLKEEYQKILGDAVEQVCGRRPRMIKTEREFVLEESDQALREKAEQRALKYNKAASSCIELKGVRVKWEKENLMAFRAAEI